MGILQDIGRWLWRLLPANPILVRVVTAGGKRKRHLAARFIYQGTVADALRRASTGSVLHVITPDDQERARQVLSELDGVENALIRDGMLVLDLRDHVSDFSFVAQAMLANNLRIHEIKREDVDLETAFMRLTKGIVQ